MSTFTLKTEFEIHSMVDAADMGGIICEIRVPGLPSEEQKEVFLCSITHFTVKRGEPHYLILETYSKKRTKKLMKQNRRR